MGLLTNYDIVLLVGPYNLKKWVYLLLVTLSYWLVKITLDLGLLTSSDIVLLVGPNILRSGSTYY